ncbi:Lysozyme [compost metagenome]
MSYIGMDAKTGRRMSGNDHLRQSVGKIIGTSIGERLRRRPFGSLAANLVDAPVNSALLVQLFSATATALLTWEPRLKVRSVSAQADATRPGQLAITVEAEALIDGGMRAVSVSAAIGA